LYKPGDVNITTELLELFEKSLAEGKARLAKATEDDLQPTPEKLGQVVQINIEAVVCGNSFCDI
jgi:hypothetical protein